MPKAKQAKNKKPTLELKQVDKPNDKSDDQAETESIASKKSVKFAPRDTKEKYEYIPMVRMEVVYVTPENRITSEIMTKFEYVEVISQRAKQIENGGPIFTDVGELTDPLDQAKKELLDKQCPLDIIRHITDRVAERWHVNEMAVPDF